MPHASHPETMSVGTVEEICWLSHENLSKRAPVFVKGPAEGLCLPTCLYTPYGRYFRDADSEIVILSEVFEERRFMMAPICHEPGKPVAGAEMIEVRFHQHIEAEPFAPNREAALIPRPLIRFQPEKLSQ